MPDSTPDHSSHDDKPAAAASLRILVAEDNPVNARVITLILKRLGHGCDVAVNGQEALDQLVITPYDVVFMDLHMPELDGIEATRRFRESNPATDPPYILALTANDEDENREACATVGMHDFECKPARVEKIAAALDRASRWLEDHGHRQHPD